jgi:transcriptional regulator with XRE-family HTH domain
MTIRDKINTLKSIGWTRYRIAQELKTSNQTIYNWFHGYSEPSAPLLYVFNKFYEKTIKEEK